MAEARISLPRAAAEGLRLACPDTLAGLVAEVAGILGDPGVAEEEIARALARGLFAVAGRVRLPWLAAEARLPFGPGQGDVALPADLQHGPTDAFLLPGRCRVRVLPDLATLRRTVRYGARSRIRVAAAGAGRLFVRPVPVAAVEVVLSYHRLPDTLVAPSDRPVCLPPHLAGPLLVSFACRECFERLEEGAGGKKIQTTAYGARFDVALAELLALCRPAVFQDEPVDLPVVGESPYAFGEDWP
jgi:hypothetical protein